MGVTIPRQKSVVHPMESAKTQVSNSKPIYMRFCSPCYHKKKTIHTRSLPKELPFNNNNIGSIDNLGRDESLLHLPIPENLRNGPKKLSPIPSIHSPMHLLKTLDQIDSAENGKTSRKMSEQNPQQSNTDTPKFPISIFSPQTKIVTEVKTIETLGDESSEKNPDKKLLKLTIQNNNRNSEKMDDTTKIAISIEKTTVESKLGRFFEEGLIKEQQKGSLKTQDSKMLEESIRMGPLPEFQVNNFSELIPAHQQSNLPDDLVNLRKIQLNFQKGNRIAKGTKSKVYECLNLDSGEILAVKTMNAKLIEPSNAIYFQEKLLGLKNENVLGYLDFGFEKDGTSSDEIELVSEYISGGSLKNILEKFGKFEENVSSLFTAQIMNGLKFLHERSILHRNLKSTNCLVESNGTVKLSDYFLVPFSLSVSIDKGSDILTSEQSIDSEVVSENSLTNTINPFDPRHWMAPETYFSNDFSEKTDIWSLGCIVFEMLVGKSLFNIAMSQNKSVEDYYKDVTAFFPDKLSENSRNFLALALKINPEERGALDLLKNQKFIDAQGVENIEEDNEDNSNFLGRGSNLLGRGLDNNDKGSVLSKSNFSVLASLVNCSLQDSNHFTNTTKNLKKKSAKKSNLKNGKDEKCNLKKIFKTGEWGKKVIEEKEMEKSYVEDESSEGFNEKKRKEFEQNLMKEIQNNNTSLDFNAKKRMEFEQKMLKELSSVRESSLDTNTKKRMEFERNLMNELAGE